jgi:hypothetical protein
MTFGGDPKVHILGVRLLSTILVIAHATITQQPATTAAAATKTNFDANAFRLPPFDRNENEKQAD